VLDQICRDFLDARLGANELFQRRPFRLGGFA
jgi:hypothetical protein